MKTTKLFLLLFVLLDGVTASAQVGIGTSNPNASAQLGCKFCHKGFFTSPHDHYST